ncbi:MAG TPA: hypothetical protein VGI39_32065 [Polyangiaceae bacterium]
MRRRAVRLALTSRAGELRVLRWEDVELVHGSIHVQPPATITP